MFKDRLREARQTASLTQQQLAREIGVAKSTVTSYELGNSEPDMAKLDRIMSVLHIDANYLFQDEMNARKVSGSTTRNKGMAADESKLLSNYRSSSAKGRAVISCHAEIVAHELPRIPATATIKPKKITDLPLAPGVTADPDYPDYDEDDIITRAAHKHTRSIAELNHEDEY